MILTNTETELLRYSTRIRMEFFTLAMLSVESKTTLSTVALSWASGITLNWFNRRLLERFVILNIEPIQQTTSEKVYYSVSIDGEEVMSVENTDARAFEEVQVFAGDNFYPPTDGSYRNLIWQKKPSVKYLSKTYFFHSL